MEWLWENKTLIILIVVGFHVFLLLLIFLRRFIKSKQTNVGPTNVFIPSRASSELRTQEHLFQYARKLSSEEYEDNKVSYTSAQLRNLYESPEYRKMVQEREGEGAQVRNEYY